MADPEATVLTEAPPSHGSESEKSGEEGCDSLAAVNATKFESELWLSMEAMEEMGIRQDLRSSFRDSKYQYAFSVPTWYEDLRDHTFATEILDFSPAEGAALIHGHMVVNGHREPDDEVTATLNALEARLDEAITTRFPNGCFLKLGTRSPKDVPIDICKENEWVQDLVRAELDAIDPAERTEGDEFFAFIKATNRSLRVNDGARAMFLLLRSGRVFSDLNKIADYPPEHFSRTIALREWLDEVPGNAHREWRCFVYKGVLNAVTQYFTMVRFDELVRDRDEIAARIQAYHAEIAPLIKHSSYVIDFYVTDDRIITIELNPFHSKAGAGLFSWKDDREVLMNGPFEMRVTEESEDLLVLRYLPRFWADFISESRPEGCPARLAAEAREAERAARKAAKEAADGDESGGGCHIS